MYIVDHALQVVDDALSAGLDKFEVQDRERVRKSQRDLRISETLAKDILGTSARRSFTGYITKSRMHRDRLEAAKELKKMVYFSNFIVGPLLEETQVCTVVSRHKDACDRDILFVRTRKRRTNHCILTAAIVLSKDKLT